MLVILKGFPLANWVKMGTAEMEEPKGVAPLNKLLVLVTE